MSTLKLNETPVRTSKNFQINNIKIDNFQFPKEYRNFGNVEILNNDTKVIIDENISKTDLKYGLGKDVLENNNENSNNKIKLEINSKTNKEISINYNFDKNNLNLLENIEIVANENSDETIIIKYNCIEKIEAFHNGIIRVNAKNNSNVNVIIVNLLNENSNNFLSIENKLEENSRVNYYIIDFGGKNSITNYYSNLIGKNSDSRLNTIYLGREKQSFDLNYIAELYGEKSNVDIEVQGALKDTAKKSFKGTIDFKKGSKKATGNENENCILLSDTARSIALPMLLCSEEDVEGNHSSSAGKIGEKELFYIMSRGFELKEAMKLMVKAKFNKILNKIKNEELRNEILEKIDTILE